MSCKVYIACLASYNSGILHGEWVDCGEGADHIKDEIGRILRGSPCPNVEVEYEGAQVPSAEEWAIHDHEGFEGFNVGEHTDPDTLSEWCEIVEELDGDEKEAFRAWMGNQDRDGDLLESFREDYQGMHDDLADYAASFTEDTGGMQDCPAHLSNYIDWEAMGRDMELSGDIWTHDAGYHRLHVFNNH